LISDVKSTSLPNACSPDILGSACAGVIVQIPVPDGREIQPLRDLEAERVDVADEGEKGCRLHRLVDAELVGGLQKVVKSPPALARPRKTPIPHLSGAVRPRSPSVFHMTLGRTRLSSVTANSAPRRTARLENRPLAAREKHSAYRRGAVFLIGKIAYFFTSGQVESASFP
jgi:hypothetical protein